MRKPITDHWSWLSVPNGAQRASFLKQQTIPSVAANGSLDDAAYTFVDVDTQRELASKILVGDQIPQIVRYSWDDDGVHVERLNGAPSADEVSRFVQGQTSVASLE